ncbi:MAG: sugar phosphate isomerase/epimerase [Devosia sp.]|nr:sugar phosphate isomerase/epimerase [Devosia sp.]
MPLPSFILPSLLVPEVYGPWKAQKGFVPAQIEAAIKDGFYRSIEISPVYDADDRAAVRRLTSENDLYLSCWLTEVLDVEKLDLTSLDEPLRAHSVEAIKQRLPAAVETGARTVAFIGGADPGPDLRERGYDAFYRSLSAISAEASNLGLTVMFEPLDRFAHKKRLIGPTAEIVDAFARVRAEHPDFGLAFDTAHAALNEEDIAASLTLAKSQIVNIHLSNAVLDNRSPLYGDHHMAPGAPGFLTVERAAAIVVQAARDGMGRHQGLPVSVEARARPADADQAMAILTRTFLEEVLIEAARLLDGQPG